MEKFSYLVLAAGKGSRIGIETADKPKYLVSVNGKSIMDHQMAIIEAFSPLNTLFVTGHCAEKLIYPGAIYVNNPEYDTSNMVYSLSCILSELDNLADRIIVGYSDLIFDENFLKKVLSYKGDFGVVIDIDWESQWELRFEEPLDDAESLSVKNGVIEFLGGKPSSRDDVYGQYVGITSFSKKKLKNVLKNYLKNLEKNDGLRNISLSEYYNTLILKNEEIINPIEVKKGWFELDTAVDIKAFENNYKSFLDEK